ncbi:MAG: acetyl-CoA carboxylase biotin carboxylase subunit [Rhizobiaceae bacterium]
MADAPGRRLKRVLVANRGEIALRVIRACRELGIETVAVFSEADRGSLPTRLADRAVCIGHSAAAKSYLNGPGIVGTAVAFGADAIHPGYGFLSENATFAALCEEQGIVFVGPRAETIRQMGDKIAAREAAKVAGIPTTPGSDGAVGDPSMAADVARAVGFPVLIKAAAGGGGRGMRVVRTRDDLANMVTEASREALAAFGDGSIYVEKYMENIRHVEVQVLGDGKDVIHLGERDCTVQRRNQKLVEEAPCVALDKGLRNELCDAAVRLCRSVGYSSAGTVEFIFDQDERRFYFIEMNTRIQVEHPVTEMITGIDLVKQQLRIAAGEPLGLRQEDVRFRGHSVECRINAENHLEGFRPAPGQVSVYSAPGGPGVRVDSHLETGATVPPFYDALLAKVVCWGEDRDEALRRIDRALREMRVEGVHTTLPFHRDLVNHPAFVSGSFSTRFVHDVLGY